MQRNGYLSSLGKKVFGP